MTRFIADTFYLDLPGKDAEAKPNNKRAIVNTARSLSASSVLNQAQLTAAYDASMSLCAAFRWQDTKEGHVFWASICTRLQDIAGGGKL
jgi:hypothetical protein